MGPLNVLTLFFTCVITNNVALLLDGDINPGHTTTLGPLGKDATLSLLVQEVLDLKARTRNPNSEDPASYLRRVKPDQQPDITTSSPNEAGQHATKC